MSDGRSASRPDGRAAAASTPLNIWSRADEEIGRLMSHFAHTPFEMDGVAFGSVEAFYTWLLVDDPSRKARIAPMWGARAKHACPKTPPAAFDYEGRRIAFASDAHMALLHRANLAKLSAHPAIASAFLGTAPRPIVHILPDREDDPQTAFCDLMERVRGDLIAALVGPERPALRRCG